MKCGRIVTHPATLSVLCAAVDRKAFRRARTGWPAR